MSTWRTGASETSPRGGRAVDGDPFRDITLVMMSGTCSVDSYANKPCVVSFHGFDLAKNQKIDDYPGKLRVLFDSVPMVLARSRSLADRLIRFGCPAQKIRINRTGIPLAEFPFTRREFPRDGSWRVLQACRLIDKKGVASAFGLLPPLPLSSRRRSL